VIVIPEHT